MAKMDLFVTLHTFCLTRCQTVKHFCQTYINLIFMNQSNFIMDSRVHSFLYPNCRHQIVYAKLNLRIE